MCSCLLKTLLLFPVQDFLATQVWKGHLTIPEYFQSAHTVVCKLLELIMGGSDSNHLPANSYLRKSLICTGNWYKIISLRQVFCQGAIRDLSPCLCPHSPLFRGWHEGMDQPQGHPTCSPAPLRTTICPCLASLTCSSSRENEDTFLLPSQLQRL